MIDESPAHMAIVPPAAAGELPTHVTELDVLRLQVAKLQSEAAIRAAHDAAEVANQALEAVAKIYRELEAKYAIGGGADEGINLKTREIMRTPRGD
jgi:hypothetical protein